MNARSGFERRKSVNPEAVHTIIGMNPAREGERERLCECVCVRESEGMRERWIKRG